MNLKVWFKDPDVAGRPCIKTSPTGKRIPDGIIWAYEASGFYRVSESSSVESDVVWSRSMIEEFGGYLDDDELVNDPEPSPSRLTPWLSRYRLSYDVTGAVIMAVRDEIDEIRVVEVCQCTKYIHSRNTDLYVYSLRKMSKLFRFYKSSLRHIVFQRSSSSTTLMDILALLDIQHQARQDMYAPFLRSVTKNLFPSLKSICSVPLLSHVWILQHTLVTEIIPAFMVPSCNSSGLIRESR